MSGRYEQVADANPAPYIRNELFFSLQSLALSVSVRCTAVTWTPMTQSLQLRDAESLRHIQACLWPELTAAQNELVHRIAALLLE